MPDSTLTMESDGQIVFYDIASAPPRRTFAPNPWKARYALNFKGVNYRTEWVQITDITRTRKELGSPPCRFFANGEPFYTLPVIKDLLTGEVVGDTLDIAFYLDKHYPDKPTLIPSRSAPDIKAFNTRVDAIFTSTVLLWCQGMRLDPAVAEEYKAKSCRRHNVESWDQFNVEGEARAKLLEDSKTALGELAKSFAQPDEPFLEGNEPIYSDLIIGGWLGAMNGGMPKDEWDDLATWHDGRWGILHSTLQERYAEMR